ncbi:putative enzymatic polyprotein, partial [Orchesella cincta]
MADKSSTRTKKTVARKKKAMVIVPDPEPTPAINATLEEHAQAIASLQSLPSQLDEIRSLLLNPNQPQVPIDDTGSTDNDSVQETIESLVKNVDDETAQETETDREDLVEILNEHQAVPEFGTSIVPEIAESFNKLARQTASKERMDSWKQTLRIPENCRNLIMPRINSEIWNMLPTRARQTDYQTQHLQQLNSQSLVALSKIAEKLFMSKSVMPTSLCQDLLRMTMDAASLACTLNQEFVTRRKQAIKPSLSKEAALLCNVPASSTIGSEYLFGENLAEQIKANRTAATIIKGPEKRNRYSPYPSQNYRGNLNYNRPSPQYQRGGQRSRPRGHWTPQSSFSRGKPKPFQSRKPTPTRFQRNEIEVVEHAIDTLVNVGAVTQVNSCKDEFISRIFTVPKKDGDPQMFTKIMKPIAAKLRSTNLLSNFYLDDILLFGNKFQECKLNIDKTTQLLESLGFIINYEKSQLIPTKKQEYLGFQYDSNEYCVRLPERKVEKIKSMINKIKTKVECSIQEAAELIGNLIAACPALKYSTLYTRQLESEKTAALQVANGNYSRKFQLSDHAVQDLNWWLLALSSPFNPIRHEKFDYTLTTDASMSGWGAHVGSKSTRGWWSVEEQAFHINTLELLAINNGLLSFFENVSQTQILVRCDNTTAIAYINKFGGCHSAINHRIAKEIWRWCQNRNIWLYASYINTRENVIADAESRKEVDKNDYELDRKSFSYICSNFGMPELDLFASVHTKKCERFFAWFPTPGAEAVDAFTVKWSENFYAFPPFSIMGKVLRKIVNDKATGIVVAPYWEAQSWYPNSNLNGSETFWQGTNLPQDVVNLLKSSCTPSTWKQYHAVIKKWKVFCDTGCVSFHSPSIQDILCFLTKLYNDGGGYVSVNCARSALSIVNQYTWDVDIVLSYIEKLPDNSDLDLRTLSIKLVTLLALASGQRVQTLSLIRVTNIRFSSRGVEIPITDRIKTSRPGKQLVLSLPAFSKDRLCVVK